MPIPPLHPKTHDDEYEEHREPSRWVKLGKGLLLLAMVGGAIYFFIKTDKEVWMRYQEHAGEQFRAFDDWMTGRINDVADWVTR
jgi:hypothetical protein